MLEKFFISLICVFLLSMTVLENSLAQYEEEFEEEEVVGDLKAHRQEILGKFGETLEFKSSGRKVESKHFRIRLDDKKSEEEFNLSEEEIKVFLSGVLYLFEEAYRLVGDDFDYHPSTKADIQIMSKGQYNLQTDRSGRYDISFRASKVRLAFSSQQVKSILTDFKEATASIYKAYILMVICAKKGLGVACSEEVYELIEFEVGKGTSCSRWLHAISVK